MGKPKVLGIAVMLVWLLATVATTAPRDNYCVPKSGLPVGHICIILG